MRSPTWLLLAVLVASALTGPAARAQEAAPATGSAAPSAAGSDDARERFKRGEAAYQKGSYELAISEWEAAYAAEARPRIQYNIYQARERLGQLVEAVDALQKYLSTADPDDPYYSDATARLASLQQRLKATGVRLIGGPEGASINISGHDWGRLPRPDPISVQPGNHRVTVSMPGYEDFVANIVVPAGQTLDVAVQLEPLSPEAAHTGAAATSSTRDSASHTDALPFFITSAALGAGAIGTAIWAINRNSALDGCDDPEFFCANKSAVTTQRTIAWGLTAALGAGAIGTLIYALVINGDDSGTSDQALLCVPDAAGATCRMRF
jgi:hypothetical protein